MTFQTPWAIYPPQQAPSDKHKHTSLVAARLLIEDVALKVNIVIIEAQS